MAATLDERLAAARRRAAWDPDGARELVIAAAEDAAGDDRELAEASELLGRIAALTGADAIAARAYGTAIDAWRAAGDPVRAAVATVLARAVPLQGFASDADAFAAELALLHRLPGGDRADLLARRGVLELHRAAAPRPVTGRIEAAFGLAPGEHALLFAVIGSLLDDDVGPLRDAAAWAERLAPSLAAPLGDAAAHLVAMGLVTATPALAPSPAVISVVLGRDRLESPPGVVLAAVEPRGAPSAWVRELALGLAGGGFGVVHGVPGSGRRTSAAAIAAQLGLGLATAAPAGGDAAALREAAVEARLLGRLLAIDVDVWRDAGVDLVALAAAGALEACEPAILIATDDPPLPAEARAFTLRTWTEEVSSP